MPRSQRHQIRAPRRDLAPDKGKHRVRRYILGLEGTPETSLLATKAGRNQVPPGHGPVSVS